MKLKNRKPTDPEVTARILQRIEQMTPEELFAFLIDRAPGVEETDMTGMFSDHPSHRRIVHTKQRVVSV